MPRKSRKSPTTTPPKPPTYQTAIYARLSNASKAHSIHNQIQLATQFISNQQDLTLTATYIDNGHTGTHFNRPAFGKMLEAIKAGEINCIIVKDLSRFGRNYIEAGHYLEKIFPFLGVRFISVTDQYDSNVLNPGSLALSLKSLVNDMYAKDISKKMSASVLARQRRGVFIGNYAPYGYQKCPIHKGRLTPDPATAPIVQNIFAQKAQGASSAKIAKKLNAQGIPSPSNYRRQQGLIKTNRYTHSLWQQQTIQSILQNPVYTGSISQGKHRRSLAKGQPATHTPPSQWINLPNMHEAIVSQGMFDQVATILATAKASYHQRPQQAASENTLKGLVACALCGANLVRRKTPAQNGFSYYYICQNFEQGRNRLCKTSKRLGEAPLLEAIETILQHQLDAFPDLTALVQKHQAPQRAKIHQAETRLANLYESYATGQLSKAAYTKAKAKIEKPATPKAPFQDLAPLIKALLHRIYVSEKNTIRITLAYKEAPL